jgi:thioesterase domain-containing protein
MDNSLSETKQGLLRALLENRERDTARATTDTPANIVQFKQGAPGGPTLFFFPATDGGASYFRYLAPHLPESAALYGCQAPGFDEEREPLGSVEEIAAYNLRHVRAIQPHGPYYIGGFCMGALPSYELACMLQADGEEVALLLNVMPVFLRPWACLPGTDALQLRAIEDHLFIFERLIGIHVVLPMDQIQALPETERYAFVTAFMRGAGHLEGPAEEHLFMHRMKMYEAGLRAMLGYRPARPFRGPIEVVVVGKPDRGELELDLNTSYTVALRNTPPEQIRYHPLDADSAAMFSGSEPDSGLIARRMGEFLR